MTANRHRAFGEHFYGIRKPGATFDFDHIRARAHHDGGVFKCLLRSGVSHKRQVGEQQAVGRATAHGAGVVGNVFHGDRQGGVVPLYRHAQRIANQHHVEANIGEQFSKAIVVGSDCCEALFLLFAFLQHSDSSGFAHNLSGHNIDE